MRIAILDMQPIDPPVGGGRLRLLGLYHGLGAEHAATYVGSYDWPGPGFRDQMLSPTLREIMVPLSEAHFAEAKRQRRAAGGKTVIDSTFHTTAQLSPDYVAAARRAAAEADAVVFSHPWVYPLARDVLDPSRQLIVYDAHNVEGLLRTELLDDQGAGTQIARGVVDVEVRLCRAADLILACSHEDRLLFSRLYDIPPGKIRVAANGAFTRQIPRPTTAERREIRDRLGLGDRPVAFFLGSLYAPNLEAAQFIASTLAPQVPEVLFVIGGGAGDEVRKAGLEAANLVVTGGLSEDAKRDWLSVTDIAVNPMFSGSGTNIKMLEFMAWGLPIVTTRVGARGIETANTAFLVADADGFATAVSRLAANAPAREELSDAARTEADRSYSWERISANVGRLLQHRHQALGRPVFFSIVVPTYERHDHLSRLMARLASQSDDDFEVIVIDQSAEPWPDRDKPFGFRLTYVHTDVRGAVPARNTGADLAVGEVIAFTDDDCEPGQDWLASARPLFDDPGVVGVEGLVLSDRVDDPEWRPVTNEGFEGLAFMTANFFLRMEAFHALNGFDLLFDNPHFREDTDLGWRALELGRVPFSHEAWVFHPPHPRSVERESLAERSRFFEKDALLYRKHPSRYLQLFWRECQWRHNPFFWAYLRRGAEKYGVELPEELKPAG
ncbi:glycosyltransferase [Inquilinus sp. OTU3971]|uniref:glycosyltransferase n=1 Tax=Inquilinus sp. OTU3971 TaxID=3043855 RepID=UPI00313CEAD1